MTKVSEINDPAQLAPLRDAWEALFQQTPHAAFYHTLDWLEAYWRHFGQGQRLRVLMIEGPQGLQGIVPLVVRMERTRIGAVRVLTYPLHDWGSFYRPLGPDLAACLTPALAHIRAAPRDWDMLDLRWIASGELDCTAQAMRAAGFQARQEPWIQTSLVDMERLKWPTYWAGRTSRWRNNVRRNERKLAASGPLKYVRYRTPDVQSGPMDPR